MCINVNRSLLTRISITSIFFQTEKLKMIEEEERIRSIFKQWKYFCIIAIGWNLRHFDLQTRRNLINQLFSKASRRNNSWQTWFLFSRPDTNRCQLKRLIVSLVSTRVHVVDYTRSKPRFKWEIIGRWKRRDDDNGGRRATRIYLDRY